MDITNISTSTSNSWDLDMGNQILLDHTPFELLHPIDHHPFQSRAIPPPSYHNGQIGIPREMEIVEHEEDEEDGLGAMKEMMYKIAAMQPVDIDLATIKKPKRRNVRISDDPQSIAARHRRERISERIRILQRLVPGGTKMDTASMLDEAIRYVKFLKRQVQELQSSQAPMPVAAMDYWPPGMRADIHGSSSSSSSALGALLPGLGFGFAGDGSGDHLH